MCEKNIFQISTFDAFIAGDYYGSVKTGELLEHGDIGHGTFDGANGEMIILDGECYRAAGDGRVEKVDGDETIPFGWTTFFAEDMSEEIKNAVSKEDVEKIISEKIYSLGKNSFYVARIDGDFDHIRVRSVIKQTAPYKPFARIMKDAQRVYEYEKISGSLVGLWCPQFAGHINSAGWHMHFISDDRSVGGHVLDFNMKNGVYRLDKLNDFSLKLPVGEHYDSLDLSAVTDAIVTAVKTGTIIE